MLKKLSKKEILTQKVKKLLRKKQLLFGTIDTFFEEDIKREELFGKSDITYELLGVEHLEFYNHKFDMIFMLGVLYHRSDPVAMLKQLFKGLDKQGEVILDTFYIEGEGEMCLCPESSYSKIPNIYFVPTIGALKNWCLRAGFKSFEILETSVTAIEEQRKTKWIEGQSLEDFLDPDDPDKTVEGYPAPKRVYIKALKA